jgi:hypothetical protein
MLSVLFVSSKKSEIISLSPEQQPVNGAIMANYLFLISYVFTKVLFGTFSKIIQINSMGFKNGFKNGLNTYKKVKIKCLILLEIIIIQ